MAENPYSKYAKPGAQVPSEPDDANAPQLPETAVNPYEKHTAQQPRDTTPEGPPQEKISGGHAFVRGAANGASANFADEISGLVAAGGGMPSSGGAAFAQSPTVVMAAGASKVLKEWLEGKTGPSTDAYTQARDAWRAATKNAEAQQPGASLAGNFAGAIATPVPGRAIAQGAPLAARIAVGIEKGVVGGAMSGAGEGEDAEGRVKGAAAGGVIGGLAGGVLTPVADVIGSGGSFAWNKLRNAYDWISGSEDAAQRLTAQTVQSAQQRGGPSTIMQNDVAGLEARGQPVMNADLAGPRGVKLMKWAKGTPGAEEGVNEARAALQYRYDTQGERAAEHVYNVTGIGDDVNFQRIMQNSRIANQPAYQRAINDARTLERSLPTGQFALWNREFERLSQEPDIRDAMLSVGRKEAARSILGGFQSPAQNPFTTRPDSYRLALATDQNGNTIIPSLEAWDNVQRVLRGQLDEARRSGNRERTRELGMARDQLLDAIDNIIPSFRDARGTAFRGFQAEDAYEAGWNYLRQNTDLRTREALGRQITTMNANDRALFMTGFAQRLINESTEGSSSQNIVTRLLNSPAQRARAQQALGADRFNEIQSFIDVERIFERSRSAFAGSDTAENLRYALATVSPAAFTAILTGTLDPASMGVGAALALSRAGMRRGQARLAERIAELLTSSDPTDLQRGITLISRNYNMRNNLTQYADRLAAQPASRELSGSVPAYLGVNARSEDNSVPGPR